jgi:SAM-dependent methyltransferase
MNRVELLRHIDVACGRGLEIGPLISPAVTKEMGEVYYADHATTEELRKKYRTDPLVDESKIMPVDFVWGAHTLLEAVGDKAPFDYVVASHVVEHVPDLAGWLREISAILRPGGRLSLCAPDRRFTFDVRRRDTDIADVIEAHLLGLRRPALGATFDHFYRHVPVDAPALWRGERGHDDPPLNLMGALGIARTAATTSQYIDTHCWVFSDAGFVSLLRTMMQADLIDLHVVSFTPTRINDIEFFITLEKAGDALPEEARIGRNVASLTVADSAERPPYQSREELEARLHALGASVSALQHTLSLIQESESWRLTAPLRRLADALRRLRG